MEELRSKRYVDNELVKNLNVLLSGILCVSGIGIILTMIGIYNIVIGTGSEVSKELVKEVGVTFTEGESSVITLLMYVGISLMVIGIIVFLKYLKLKIELLKYKKLKKVKYANKLISILGSICVIIILVLIDIKVIGYIIQIGGTNIITVMVIMLHGIIYILVMGKINIVGKIISKLYDDKV